MLTAFLLAFPALFTIVNPIAGGFIFREATAARTHAGRVLLARRIGVYALLVMLTALWAGSYVLAVFGISIAALRIAGGLVLAMFAWGLLDAPERRDERKQAEAAGGAGSGEGDDDPAFFPLTLPFTTGPGTIAVSVALGAGRPAPGNGLGAFFVGVSLAACAVALLIWLIYANADRIGALLGQGGSRTVTRLSAFLLFCIGVQVLVTGAMDVLGPLLRGH
jgi:multiple antibiotic resistance protein